MKEELKEKKEKEGNQREVHRFLVGLRDTHLYLNSETTNLFRNTSWYYLVSFLQLFFARAAFLVVKRDYDGSVHTSVLHLCPSLPLFHRASTLNKSLSKKTNPSKSMYTS